MANGSIALKDVDQKFIDILEQIILIHQRKIKCSVSLNFSGNPDVFTFRYTNIDPFELHGIASELLNKSEREKNNVGVFHQSTGHD